MSRLTVLVALGTHAPMGEEALAAHLGYAPGRLEETYPGITVVNHEWWEPETFADLGTIPAARIVELSEGRMDLDVPVLLNRAVVEHDVALVVGPVLPHEVVGISGGNKYFFPGVAGQKIIDVSHWLGALITSAEIIGTTGITPVRALIDEGAALIPSEKLAFCVVTAEVADGAVDGAVDAAVTSPVRTSGLHSVSFGDTRASWASAAEVCAATHVTYLDAPVRRVLSIVPEMYDEIWTGAKGFYKLEPVVADGGEVILYAPHITRDLLDAPGDLRHRLPLPRLLREAVGPVLARALGRARALDAPARRRHLRRGDRRGAAARGGDAGDGDPRGRLPRGEPRLPGPGVGRRRGVRGRPGHARGAAGGRDAVPAALSDVAGGPVDSRTTSFTGSTRVSPLVRAPAASASTLPTPSGTRLAHGRRDGGQRRVHDLGEQHVVEPDDAHVAGHRARRAA